MTNIDDSGNVTPGEPDAAISDLGGQSFEDCSFSRWDLEGTVFADCVFRRVDFRGADLMGASFERCTFVACDLSNADLACAILDTVDIEDSKLLGTSLAEARIRSVHITSSRAVMAGFMRSSLRQVTMQGCDLTEADFAESRITDAAFVHCDLSGVLLTRAAASRLDIRDSTVDGSFGLSDLEGVTVGTDQLLLLASVALAQLGGVVDDRDVPPAGDLPGAADVALLHPPDAQAASDGLEQARTHPAHAPGGEIDA